MWWLIVCLDRCSLTRVVLFSTMNSFIVVKQQPIRATLSRITNLHILYTFCIFMPKQVILDLMCNKLTSDYGMDLIQVLVYTRAFIWYPV